MSLFLGEDGALFVYEHGGVLDGDFLDVVFVDFELEESLILWLVEV